MRSKDLSPFPLWKLPFTGKHREEKRVMLRKKEVIRVGGYHGDDQPSTALSPDVYYIACSGFNYSAGVQC